MGKLSQKNTSFPCLLPSLTPCNPLQNADLILFVYILLVTENRILLVSVPLFLSCQHLISKMYFVKNISASVGN